MREERATLNEISSRTFDLGYVGEKNHVKVVIVCTSMFVKYPDAVVTMVAKPPVGEMYPVTLTQDGNEVTWMVSESDIAYAGSGQFQLTFTEGNEVIKREYGSYSIKSSMASEGNPPTPFEDWLDEAQEALEGFEQDTSDAEAYAVGTRGGTAVASDDPAYHNNAKYYAEHISMTVSGTKLILSNS